MSDDAGRSRPTTDPAAGGLAPADAADPALRSSGTGAPAPATVPGTTASGPAPQPDPVVKHSRTSGLWVGLILSALVLLFLLIFILQNSRPVLISFFALEGTIPVGVALLLAAIAGILLVAIPGSVRILQLRRAAKRAGRVH